MLNSTIEKFDLKKLWETLYISVDTDESEITQNMFVAFFNSAIWRINSVVETNYYTITDATKYYIGMPPSLAYILFNILKYNYFEYDGETEGKMNRADQSVNGYLSTFLNSKNTIPLQFRQKKQKKLLTPLLQKHIFYNGTYEEFTNLTDEDKKNFIINNTWIDDNKNIFCNLSELKPEYYEITINDDKTIDINWNKIYNVNSSSTPLYLYDYNNNYENIVVGIKLKLITREGIQ